MFASSPTQSSNLSNGTGQSSRARILQQTVLDAVLDANYERHGDRFDYSKLSESQRLVSNQQHSEKVIPYLNELKKGNLIQPFGCLLALDATTLKVIAFSENAPEMLTAIGHADDFPTLCIGTNIVTLFAEPGATTLNMVLGLADASSLNPIIVQCKASGEPLYAIVHQATGCLVVDFEPVNPSEFPTAVAWASQSYKLAATAISKIQSLPGGSMQVLCNTLVQEVFDLMGYDRVMAYKFHEDFHGEVIAEMTKPGLETYLGLHYPATDIPQAARLLFMKNNVCMITDCRMRPVKIIEDKELHFHVSLCGSALRAPHSCHLQYMENMRSVASLVMAVVVNEDGENFEVTTEEQTQKNQRKKLWGLIVCHHGSPRYVPFPLQHGCEFIGQVFAVHISKEIELQKRMQEKSILCMQSMLTSMMFRQPCPLSIWEVSGNDSNLLTPMFGADQSGKCSEWDSAMAMLTGWHREEVLHKMLLQEVFDSSNTPCIMLKDKDAYVSICILINSILSSDKIENQVPFGFFDRNGWYIECLLSVKRKENADGVLTGVSFFILFSSHEQQHTLQVQQAHEKTTLERSRCLDLRMDEFVLQDMVVAPLSKVQTACQGKGIIVFCDLVEKFLKQRLYGDCIQLQKILYDFLFASVKFCPIGGSVTISSNRTKNSIGENIDLIDLELRIKEQVIVVPEEILAHMFQEGHGHQLEQGFTLVVCRNLLSLMN